MNEPQTTLRDELEKNFAAAAQAEVAQAEPVTTDNEPAKIIETRTRDEKGRFVPKQEAEAPKEPAQEEAQPEQPAQEPPKRPRPTTWKKDYLPFLDKLEAGIDLTPEERQAHLEYIVQRENEYKRGVSTYRTEAEQAKALFERLSPAMSYLQQHNIAPADFVGNLTQAHIALSSGTPQQKVAMFQQLAQSYGIHPQMLFQQGGESQIINDLMAKIHSLESEVASVNNWRTNQETSSYQTLINDFKASGKAPYFDDVAPDMAILLQSGRADSLEAAYRMAVRMNDEVFEREQERTRTERDKAAAAERAKAAAVSPRSSTPSGNTSGAPPDTSIRGILKAQLAAQEGRV